MKKVLFYLTLLAALVTAFLVIRAITGRADIERRTPFERSCGAGFTPQDIKG